MPWKEVSKMCQKEEFVLLASCAGANRRELCRRFGISSRTGYKWLNRYQTQGKKGLEESSRKPKRIPHRTAKTIEEKIIKVRCENPSWGAYKIKVYCERQGIKRLPSVTVVHDILKRHGHITEEASAQHTRWKRFEHQHPNELWQMDFKGHFGLRAGRCHPLTLLDDHSRFSLCLQACEQETGDTVKAVLTQVFRCYGLPDGMIMDNGAPWGSSNRVQDYTRLSLWLIQLGVRVSHSRPGHPQTQGKLERFHRTLKAELLREHAFETCQQAQKAFDKWRMQYNCERPHQAIGMAVPIEKYKPSQKRFPEQLPQIEYGSEDIVRIVQRDGLISYKGRYYWIGKALRNYPIALRFNRNQADKVDVYFCHQKIKKLDLKDYR